GADRSRAFADATNAEVLQLPNRWTARHRQDVDRSVDLCHQGLDGLAMHGARHEEAVRSRFAITVRSHDALAKLLPLVADLEPEAVGARVHHDRHAAVSGSIAHRTN